MIYKIKSQEDCMILYPPHTKTILLALVHLYTHKLHTCNYSWPIKKKGGSNTALNCIMKMMD